MCVTTYALSVMMPYIICVLILPSQFSYIDIIKSTVYIAPHTHTSQSRMTSQTNTNKETIHIKMHVDFVLRSR